MISGNGPIREEHDSVVLSNVQSREGRDIESGNTDKAVKNVAGELENTFLTGWSVTRIS
jgi:hypothetical protein